MNEIVVNMIPLKKIIIIGIYVHVLIYTGVFLNFKFVHWLGYGAVFPIFWCIAVFSWAIIEYKKITKKAIFSFQENCIEIKGLKKIENFIYSEISNYAVYYFGLKKWGNILRIRTDKNYFYFIVPKNINGINQVDIENLKKLNNFFAEKIEYKNEKLFIDNLIIFLAFLPFIIIAAGLIFVLIYFL